MKHLAYALGCGALAASLAGCPGADPRPDPPPGGEVVTPPPAGGGGAGEAKGWDCEGDLVPPTGYEQETAFVSVTDGGGLQEATELARRRLVGRLCGAGSNCDALSSRSVVWKTGQGPQKACAMVVIEGREVDDWRRDATSLEKLGADLEKAAGELLAGARTDKKPSVAIDKIIDGGVAGGERANWLGARMTRAFNKVGAQVREVPASWGGKGFPPGVDALISARTTIRNERQRTVVEVIWEARLAGKDGASVISSEPVIFPADAAPALTSVVEALPPSDPNLSVRLETRHSGGGLCLGEQTQLWLYSQSDLHVRVFDLYGKDGALLLFPNPDRPDGRVRAGEQLPLGGAGGFEAVPAPGFEVERFLVIGAPTEAALGRYAAMKGYCRLGTSLGAQLHAAKGFPPGAKAASDGFRLITGGECPAPPGAEKQAEMIQGLNALPECQ